MPITLQHATTEHRTGNKHLASYRARTRPYNQACPMDPSLDIFIQLKAKNAEEAFRSACLVADDKTIVLDVERIDG